MSKGRRRPWWLPPFVGGVPDVEPRLLDLLGLVSLALFFESYDISMLTSALKLIAADLDIPATDLGGYLGTIRLGALPALLVVPLTDRIGRRRVFLFTIAGLSLGTFLTAFARTPYEFVALQMATRTFVLAAAAVAVVIVTEEFPAAHRGWAIGMMGALSACGHGLGAALFAAVNHLPYGWRALYVVGAVPLLLMPFFRRAVPETTRFAALSREQHGAPRGGWAAPLLDLARTHPGRALVLALAAGLQAVGEVSVFQFTGYFTQTAHGWTPGQYATMVIVGGGLGIAGNVVAGHLGDRVGRRPVGALFLVLFPLFANLFYQGPSWVLTGAWCAFVFCSTASLVVMRALSTELFPTSHRATSAGWIALVQTLGWALGLWIVGLGTQAPEDIAHLTSQLSLVVAAAAVVLFFLPETSRRELESLSRSHG